MERERRTHFFDFHSKQQRILSSDTRVFTGFFYEDFFTWSKDLPSETLKSRHISPLSICVQNVILFPVTQTTIFSLLKNMRSILTWVNRIKHDIWIITIGCNLCTQSLWSWNHSSIITSDGAWGRLSDDFPALTDPCCTREEFIVTQWFRIDIRWIRSKLKFKYVRWSPLEPDTLVVWITTLSYGVDDESIISWWQGWCWSIDTFRCQCSEVIMFILENEGISIDLWFFPLCLSPLREATFRWLN